MVWLMSFYQKIATDISRDGQDTTAIEDRCRILRRKIDLVEDELSMAGK